MLGGPLDQTALRKGDSAELLHGKESTMSLISWHSSRLRRVARSSSSAEVQAAADGDDEPVYIRLCLKKKFCLDSWICKTGNRKREKFLMLWLWTVVVFTALWLPLRLPV